MAAKAKKKQEKIDPFKVKKTSTGSGRSLDTLVPPDEIKELIDEFREAAQNAKRFDGEKKALAAKIQAWALQKAAERRMNGITSNFNISGEKTTCQFQLTEKIKSVDEEGMAGFVEQYSEKLANDVFKKDYGSIRFEADYLEKHWDEIIEKLIDALGPHMEHLFKPATFCLADHGLEKASNAVKTPEKLVELLKAMKVTYFVK